MVGLTAGTQTFERTGTFPRGYSARQANVANAVLLAQLARETGGVIERRYQTAAADELALRGIPAIGRGVAGVIRGTQPGQEARH